MQLGGLVSTVSSPSESARSPAVQRHFMHCWSENALSGKAFNAARESGERYKFPQWVRAERGRQTTFGHFWSENALSGKALAS